MLAPILAAAFGLLSIAGLFVWGAVKLAAAADKRSEQELADIAAGDIIHVPSQFARNREES